MPGDSVILTGLDGSNPLAFFAALGVMCVLDHRWGAGGRAGPRPLLGWEERGGRWRPRVFTAEDIVAAVCEDLVAWRAEPVLDLAYTKEGTRTAVEAGIADLKPPPDVARDFLGELGARAAAGDRRSADLAAAWFTDVAVDGKGNAKPTALHFTAGQQTYVKMVRSLRDGVARVDVEEALFGPWRGESKLPSLSWDASVSRLYALRATDPSKEKRGSVPGADWLASVGLAMLPVAPRGSRVVTPGVSGGWKSGTLTWVLWGVPAPRRSVQSLLAGRVPAPAERSARNVVAVYSASILRSDTGGYGSFAPARVV